MTDFTGFMMKYWLEFLMGIVASALTAAYSRLARKMKEIKVENKASANGVKALLRDRIIQSCNHYRDKGYCPIYGLENIESLYKEYKALGGNGAMETLVGEMHKLPRAHGRAAREACDQPRALKE